MGNGENRLNYYFVAGFFWLALVAFSFFWNMEGIERSKTDLVMSKARGFVSIIQTNLDLKFEHDAYGSQFASTSKMSEINAGDYRFIRMDPEHLKRQIGEVSMGAGTIIYNITSLKLMGGNNRPDQWEVATLTELEKGRSEKLSLVDEEGGVMLYRYMSPLYVDNGCLNCHFDQGYRLGDTRGGISVAFDASSYVADRKTSITNQIVLHAGLVIIGFTVIFAYKRSVSIADREAEEARERYKSLIEITDAVHWEVDARTMRFIYISPQAESMFGYPVSEWKDFAFWKSRIHPKDMDWASQYCLDKTAALEDHIFTYRIIAADGRTVWIRDTVSVEAGEDGRPALLRGMFVDVTELKDAEAKLKLSLAEKEVLLKEVHHRVKNNMAVISSLQSLQMRQTDDEAARAALEESRNRIKAMTLVHEKLYQSENLASVALEDYLTSLMRMIKGSFGQHAEHINFDLNVTSGTLGVDSLIPIGLIINELVTNSIKYAFSPEISDPRITIQCIMEESGDIALTVGDNGAGFLGEVRFDNKGSLGLRLVDVLVKQLVGTLEVGPGPGAMFIMRFPRQDRDVFGN